MMLIAPLGLSYRPPSPGGRWLLEECPDNFENGKFMLSKVQLVEQEEWITRRFHIWYMHVAPMGFDSVMVKVPKELFHRDDDYYMPVNFKDMHIMLRCKDIDVSLVTLFAM